MDMNWSRGYWLCSIVFGSHFMQLAFTASSDYLSATCAGGACGGLFNLCNLGWYVQSWGQGAIYNNQLEHLLT